MTKKQQKALQSHIFNNNCVPDITLKANEDITAMK